MNGAIECIAKCEPVIRCEEDIKNLIGWQKSQNGAIHRVEQTTNEIQAKLDKKFETLLYWIMGQMFLTIITIASIYFSKQ